MQRRPTVGKREIADRQRRLRATLGAQILELRVEAGVSQRALAAAVGTAQSHLSQIEHGRSHATLELLVQVGAWLGADLSCRYFPVATPRLRDHIQAVMVEALLRRLDSRWHPVPELPVPAARGVIDVALRTPHGPSIVVEVHSQIRSIDVVLRRLHEKTLALAQIPGYGPEASGLLILRSTARNRELVRLHEATFAAAFPGSCRSALAALAGPELAGPRGAWPGSTLLWARVDPAETTLLDRPPRLLSVGR